MKYVFLALTLLALITATSALDLRLLNPLCYNDGHFEVKVAHEVGSAYGQIDTEDLTISIQEPSEKIIPATGSFDEEDVVYLDRLVEKSIFTSEEAFANKEGYSTVWLNYEWEGEERTASTQMYCLGLNTSCKFFNVDVTSCDNNNGTLNAAFIVEGIDEISKYPTAEQVTLDSLDFKITAEERFCDKNNNCATTAGLPASAVVNQVSGDSFSVTWDYGADNQVTGFGIEIPHLLESGCLTSNYAKEYPPKDYKKCEVDPTPKLSCTGCEIEDVCIPKGGEVLVKGKKSYCSASRTIEPKLKDNFPCISNYQCLSGTCYEKHCETITSCAFGLADEPCFCSEQIISQGQACCNGVASTTCADTTPVEPEPVEPIEEPVEPEEEKKGFWGWLKSLFGF